MKQYTSPTVKIHSLAKEDVIVASGNLWTLSTAQDNDNAYKGTWVELFKGLSID